MVLYKKLSFLLCIMLIIFVGGCNKKQTIDMSQERLQELVATKSSDPVVQQELIFMQQNMGVNISKVSIWKDTMSWTYGVSQGWEVLGIPRSLVQENMKRYEAKLQKEYEESQKKSSFSKWIKNLTYSL